MEFLVTNEKTVQKVDEIIDFLKGPRLYIPNTTYSGHTTWLEHKAYPQLKNGAKLATVCFDKSLVSGVVIYQEHPTLKNTVEIRNITVRPTSRGRLFGSFLLRNTELEAKYCLGAKELVIDCKLQNANMMQFLLRNGYMVKQVVDLYKVGDGMDVVFSKKI